MKKYRFDIAESQADGATTHWSKWLGGPSLAGVSNCRLVNLEGNMRRTVYVTGEADTYFSIPAVCKLAGKRITGCLTGDDDGNLVFCHCYY